MATTKNHHYLIKKCYQQILEPMKKLSIELAIEIEKALESNIEQAFSNQMYMAAFENSTLFLKNKKTIVQHFYREITQGFEKFKAHDLATHIREGNSHNKTWTLVDDSIIEENIAISSLSSEANNEHKEDLWLLQKRLTFINGDIAVDESSNPLSPVQFFVALRSAYKLTPIDISAKVASYKVLASLIKQHYPNIINQANNGLIEAGILPELNYEKDYREKAPHRSHTKTDTNNVNDPQKNTTDDIDTAVNQEPKNPPSTSQISLVNSIRELLQRVRYNSDKDTQPHPQVNNSDNNSLASTVSNASGEALVFNNFQIIEAVEAGHNSTAITHFFSKENSNEILQTPTNIEKNSEQVYQQLHQAFPNGTIDNENMHTIDMVGMLFEYILADKNLPDSIKTLLSHLHTPFLKLAFLDPNFFENKEHKSRILLDSLAEAGASWVDHDGTAQYDMYNEIKHVIKRVMQEFNNDVNFFSELLIDFDLLKKRIGHMHNFKERNSIEKKQGQEKLDHAKTIARASIKQKIEGRRLPSAMISLLSPWFTYLTLIHLKESSTSERWQQALTVIDNLLTYSSIKKVNQEASHLAEDFEQLIKQVTLGLNSISYNSTKATLIIDELEKLKTKVLKQQVIITTSATEHSKKYASELKDGAAEEPDLPPTAEEEQAMNYIKLIEPGTWIEYEKRARLKVKGFNSETRKYILIDQSSQQVIMLSRLAFARDILAERATVIDGNAKPLFERALERIRQNLDKQVQASTA
jgi:hypothetical protein